MPLHPQAQAYLDQIASLPALPRGANAKLNRRALRALLEADHDPA